MHEKKNVALDASILISLSQEESVFDENGIEFQWDESYPKEEYNRCVSDNAALELISKRDGNRIDQSEKRAEFLKTHQLKLLKNNKNILMHQYIHGFRKNDSYIFDEKIQNSADGYLNSPYPDPNIQDKSKTVRMNLNDTAKYSSVDKDVNDINVQGIIASVEKNIKDGYYITVEEGNESHPFEHAAIEISQPDRMWLNFRDKGRQHLRKPRMFHCLKTDYPTLYMLLVLQAFLASISSQRIKLPDFPNIVKVTGNVEVDLMITLCIPYMDSFVTCDEGQTNIIKSFFPHYTHIVHLFKANDKGK